MALVYFGLGSNLGDRRKNLDDAIDLISLEIGDVLVRSGYYAGRPWGFDSKNDFLNAAILVGTQLSPLETLDASQRIERKMGRKEKTVSSYADRIIDIDILLYDMQIIKNERLIAPHPLMHLRDFVLIPMAEIAPDLIHPVLNRSIVELKTGLSGG
ncbi:MAG: 2-amino-4-hydroxy-6-hydroxymethyldihydropteridine diphosphokinase [Prevotellaceae bacterium]|jgi:2-amino-4-hydroxy-6-hydroxymethyldihydropteridine diphosphokinase|nr:2-amino-4-hydroxy-6-hydroxymethyldihydropteridine diphosphokinase [Prevotellaceae bacterium]